MNNGKVILLEHQPQWKIIYDREAQVLHELLEHCLVSLHHVGSTSVPGLISKPIVDIVGEVKDVQQLGPLREQMEKCGYLWKGEFGIKGRAYFYKKNPEDANPHMMEDLIHLHLFTRGAKEVEPYLLFRDYLRAHPESVHNYNHLKLELQQKYKGERSQYQQGKEPFISSLIAAAGCDRAG